jgi:alkanesulfonate monooxygenase SsuD/methylene tetrahydromethanopterin reductase-like flavin-dependent oxidoreductase (luciferase family)
MLGPMRVGLYLDLRNPPAWRRPWDRFYAETLERVQEAERLGADSVWLSEHHFFDDGYLPQPLTFAAALAARTRRLRIGTAVLLAPLRPAVQIAEDAAIVDLVSGGRLELGLGAGYVAREFEAFGADLESRYRVVGERVEELRRLWRAGGVTPGPLQDPLPLWCGFATAVGARRAGRLGTGLLSPDPELAAPYLEGLAAGGHHPERARMAGPAHFILADDPEEAWARATPHFRYQWDSYRQQIAAGRQTQPPPPIDPERWRQPGPDGAPPRIGVLRADEAAQLLRRWLAGVPVREIFLWASIAGMPEDLARRHVELVCTRLRPALADA